MEIKAKWRIWITVSFLSFAVSGCAVHPPMSELLMFNRKKVGNNIYRARYSQSLISVSYQDVSRSLSDRYIKIHYHHKSTPSTTPVTLSTNPIFLSKLTDNFALSLAVGLNPGADATLRIYPKYYTTFSIDAFGGEQIIFQKRLFNSPSAGMSLGVFYKNQRHAYDYTDIINCCNYSPDLEFDTNQVGVRSVVLLHESQIKTQGFFYLTGSLGYDINMKLLAFQIGCSVGLF